ncbi:uncharacterized protein LOC111381472 [Olea europaea var. sylvestris]|uniref:uncharacterized protein LOC111381472 n=1 Tax=Olea europaea var. sylvestris TaxID=158386 RepID=UPI000C1D2E4D|nr:uncharacterized protein LOC111381472 [Olea europaea var. sylvestris]
MASLPLRGKCDIYTVHKSLKYFFTQKDLNMLQKRWLDLVKDYDCTIYYHPEENTLMFKGRLCVPKDEGIRKEILEEANYAPYAVHPGGTKMYRDLRTMPSGNCEAAWKTNIYRLRSRPKVSSKFWKSIQGTKGTNLNFSTAYHLQSDGQSDRTIQILEYMLQACVLDLGEIIARTVQTIDKIRDGIKYVQDRQKSYADQQRKLIEFEVGEKKDLTYEEAPLEIIERRTHTLRNKEIALVKVRWKNHGVEEATWEKEEEIKAKYPELFG